jgi:tetratricopeptide (TPR) repeat protein
VSAKLQQARAWYQQGQFAEARGIYEDILRIQPTNGDALNMLGFIELQRMSPSTALSFFERVIAISPHDAMAFNGRGLALQQSKRWDAALASFNQAIAIRPDYPPAHLSRGSLFIELNRLEEALVALDRAIAVKPDFALAHYNRGVVLEALARPHEAIASYDRAIALAPDADAYFNRGNVQRRDLGRLGAALASYDQTIALQPDHVGAHVNKAHILLLSGDFARGLPMYEWRLKLPDRIAAAAARRLSAPRWIGKEPLQDKTILLHNELGLGDTLQFCRYVERVAGLGARVILQVQRPLVGLLEDLAGASQVLSEDDVLPAVDYQCSLISLPLAFETRLDSIPKTARYLRSSATKEAFWRARLAGAPNPRIGLVWSGSSSHKVDHDRSLSLKQLIASLPPQFQYVSLQYEVRETDRETLRAHREILHFADELRDFTDVAALCDNLDLVISIDTNVAHLSGSLGRKTWVLLPFLPDWRWLTQRSDSPWYPTLKLYRQDAVGDWSGALTRLRQDLTGEFRHGREVGSLDATSD